MFCMARRGRREGGNRLPPENLYTYSTIVSVRTDDAHRVIHSSVVRRPSTRTRHLYDCTGNGNHRKKKKPRTNDSCTARDGRRTSSRHNAKLDFSRQSTAISAGNRCEKNPRRLFYCSSNVNVMRRSGFSVDKKNFNRTKLIPNETSVDSDCARGRCLPHETDVLPV